MSSKPLSLESFFSSHILSWFAEYKRDLPWRRTKDPYRIWISEVMLQQTQVDRVVSFYERFLVKFPTVQDLAKAEWSEVLEVWRGLGYYRRGRNMLQAAQVLVEQYGGKFPRDVATLETLPGIGKYTARAIASFAFGLDVPVKDTNVSRVLQRFFHIEDDAVWDKVAELVPKGKSSAFNQGVMELGALVCSAAAPKCQTCPVSHKCHFFTSGLAVLPAKRTRSVSAFRDLQRSRDLQPPLRVAVAVIYRDGKILVTRRKKGDSFAGLFEFPGGKVEHGESQRSALKREILEELGVEVAVRPPFSKVEYEYQGRVIGPIVISFHRCQILLGEPKPLEGQEMYWFTPADLVRKPFPPANGEILEKISAMRW